MYVCLCKGITDSQIRKAVSEGAANLQDVSNRLGVASQCGQCACVAREVISEARAGQAPGLFYAAG